MHPARCYIANGSMVEIGGCLTCENQLAGYRIDENIYKA